MAASEYHGYAPRPKGFYPLVDSILHADMLPEFAVEPLTAAHRNYLKPYVGITVDGTPVRELYRLDAPTTQPKAVEDAAVAYLEALEPYQRLVSHLPMDSPHWRLWTNAIPTWLPKGIRLDRMDEAARTLAMEIFAASLSPDGFATVQAAMRLNGALHELVDDYHDSLGEFAYWLTIYGEPGSGEPWGWQLMGHHIDLHWVSVAGQVVLAPVFLGAEPATAEFGTYAGTRGFDAETERGLALRRALDPAQEAQFLLGTSLLTADLPEELGGPFNGRHLAASGADNLILPYEGITADQLSRAQLDLLWDLLRVYIDRLPAEHAERKRREVERHLDETHFAWRGRHDDVCAFYYRIHSPVLLVEYDNHPGIFLSNDEPERFHVHTIVREPNGNDYAKDLLAQHYRLHHAGPTSQPRP